MSSVAKSRMLQNPPYYLFISRNTLSVLRVLRAGALVADPNSSKRSNIIISPIEKNKIVAKL